MTTHEQQSYRMQLQALIKRFDAQVSTMRHDAMSNPATESEGQAADSSEWGSHESEEARTLGLLHNEEDLLREVTAAIERLEQGKFGQCESCGCSIGKSRLNALPYARHCIDCARSLISSE